jgi:hypothetical protein
MTPDRKHPSPAFWITVALVAVLVGYPLSAGPFGWLSYHRLLPDWAEDAGTWFYAPVEWMSSYGPEPIRELFAFYFTIWGLPMYLD